MLAARVPIGHSAGDHLKGDPAEPSRHSDANVAMVYILDPPSRRQDAKVLILSDQVLGNDESRSPQIAVGVPHQPAIRAIDLVALIPRGYRPALVVIARALT